MRRRRLVTVKVDVSENFYNALDAHRTKLSQSQFNGFSSHKKLTFPEFTELISKSIVFPKKRRRLI